MTDDEPLPALRDQAPDARYGEAMLYDFAKFLISLCLLALGGLLTLGSAAKAGEIDRQDILVVIAALVLAGALAYTVAAGLADARSRGREPSRRYPLVIKAAAGAFGVGIGVFLNLWLDTL